MDKDQIVDLLEEIAVLLELKGENPFKALAYTKAARALDAFSGDLAKLVADDDLGSIGLGEALRLKVAEVVKTGRLEYHEKLRASVPDGLLALTAIPGLGAKRIRVLHDKLGIVSVADLEAACRANKVRALPGFAAKTEEKILEGIGRSKTYEGQHYYATALAVADELCTALRGHHHVSQLAIAGSIRRGVELVRNIDLVASSKNPAELVADFTTWTDVAKIIEQTEDSATVLLDSEIQATLRVVPDGEYAFALRHFTGSKEHNAELRAYAVAQKKELTQHGLFAIRVGTKKAAKRESIPCRNEHEVFSSLGLQEIPPELREGRGEIEAAAEKKIPRLIEWTQLRGTFHCHTTASDGKNSLEEMAHAARDLGLQYLGIADHSRSSIQANGLTEERLGEQIAAIRKLNRSLDEFHVFAGSEVDILKDGRLDFGDDVLGQLDYVVASVHNVMGQDEATMTARLIRAMENEHVTMLGHPSSRRLLQREASRVNFEKIIDCAARTGTWIELNCSSARMDMDWRWWRQARDKGVKCVINPDAHRIAAFGVLRQGVTAARKGWLRREDVMNTRTLEEITRALKA